MNHESPHPSDSAEDAGSYELDDSDGTQYGHEAVGDETQYGHEAVDHASDPPAPPAGPFDHDRFLVNQKRIAITEKYYVYDAEQNPLVFVEREAHHARRILAIIVAALSFFVLTFLGVLLMIAIGGSQKSPEPVLMMATFVAAIVGAIWLGALLYPRRHITFYADDSKRWELLKIFQDRKWQFLAATYTVADPDMNLVGWCRKNHVHDIFRKRWHVYDTQGAHICTALEDSVIKAILRRFLPLGQLLRTNYCLTAPHDGARLGTFNRRLTLFDKYVLNMTDDEARTMDRRLAIGLGVLLDTGERR